MTHVPVTDQTEVESTPKNAQLRARAWTNGRIVTGIILSAGFVHLGGKKLEALLYYCNNIEEALAQLEKEGAEGNAHAFNVWVAQERPYGYSACLPSKAEQHEHAQDPESIRVSCFRKWQHLEDSCYTMRLKEMLGSSAWQYVAFIEVSTN